MLGLFTGLYLFMVSKACCDGNNQRFHEELEYQENTVK